LADDTKKYDEKENRKSSRRGSTGRLEETKIDISILSKVSVPTRSRSNTLKESDTPLNHRSGRVRLKSVFELLEDSSLDQKEKVEKVRSQIRVRVMNVLRHWLEDHWQDFETHPHLLYQMLKWVNDVLIPSGMHAMANSLKKTIMKKLESSSQMNFPFSKKAPPPIQPKSDFDFLDVDPIEAARQICLLQQKLFRNISLREFIDQKWTKGQKDIWAPGIVGFIQNFNDLSFFVSRSVVMQLAPRKRVKNIEKWIAIAMRCREYKNFNGTMSILSGLRLAPVYRLKKTWATLDGKILGIYDQLLALMSQENNWKLYRECLGSEDPPCIPYLGVYLTDLTFLDDATPNILPNGAINFEKRMKLTEVITEVAQYQQEMYSFVEVKGILEELRRELDAQGQSYSERDLFNLSVILEPKER
jgi:hypothetical protein